MLWGLLVHINICFSTAVTYWQFYRTSFMRLCIHQKQTGERQVANMERLIYWIKKCIHHNNKFCKHFCVTCEFYDFCRRDGELD